MGQGSLPPASQRCSSSNARDVATSVCRRAQNNLISTSTAVTVAMGGAGPLAPPGLPPSYGHALASASLAVAPRQPGSEAT